MRISDQEANTIRTLTQRIFGEGSVVRLFGSRTRDDLKGGDIDLYIQPADAHNLLDKRLRFASQLEMALGEQKIDIIIARQPQRLIEQQALSTGIRL